MAPRAPCPLAPRQHPLRAGELHLLVSGCFVDQDTCFEELIRQVRAGDEQAATRLVRQYEPEIRRIARVRLGQSNLRRLLDSTDICQSVLALFFVRVTSGQLDLQSPSQLLRLLLTMACNKFNDALRKEHAVRRGGAYRPAAGDAGLGTVVGRDGDPGETVCAQDLLQTVRSRLSAEERFLAEQWALGREWPDIAADLNDTPEALRKRLRRALDRVSRQLRLEEVANE
jgi:DNA-directed RNA polymerase specialized sigma24 family protein